MKGDNDPLNKPEEELEDDFLYVSILQDDISNPFFRPSFQNIELVIRSFVNYPSRLKKHSRLEEVLNTFYERRGYNSAIEVTMNGFITYYDKIKDFRRIYHDSLMVLKEFLKTYEGGACKGGNEPFSFPRQDNKYIIDFSSKNPLIWVSHILHIKDEELKPTIVQYVRKFWTTFDPRVLVLDGKNVELLNYEKKDISFVSIFPSLSCYETHIFTFLYFLEHC